MQLSPEAKAGVTVLISIILFAAMAMAVGRIDLRRTEGIELVLSFENVGGLVEGAPVRCRCQCGCDSGTIAGSQVLVKARLTRLLIPSDSRFMLLQVFLGTNMDQLAGTGNPWLARTSAMNPVADNTIQAGEKQA